MTWPYWHAQLDEPNKLPDMRSEISLIIDMITDMWSDVDLISYRTWLADMFIGVDLIHCLTLSDMRS
jgi:hypothetical protein